MAIIPDVNWCWINFCRNLLPNSPGFYNFSFIKQFQDMKKLSLLSLFSCLFFIVQAQQTTYTKKENIAYYTGKSDAYLAERCKLDIYYPTNKKNAPAILWFHGGGLTGGGKEIPKHLLDQGFIVIGVGYRLSPKVLVKDIIDDAAQAVAWTFKNIEQYGGHKDLIFVSGHSAGGYLGMMLTLDKSYLNKLNIDANQIAGLIPFSGQAITHFTVRQERKIRDTQAIVDELSPIFHARGDAPPMLLLTGDREMEMLGRYEENAYLARMMKLNGHKNTTLYELQGYGHNMVEPAIPLLIKEVNERTKSIKAQKELQ
jgi:acetyl esterase/lipase